jgi:hypothetical protein
MILIILGFILAIGWPLFVMYLGFVGPMDDWSYTVVFLMCASIAPTIIVGSFMIVFGFTEVYTG